MSTQPEPALITVTDAAGFLSAIPVLLGFHPAESLVMVAMNGPGRRLGPVARVDLPRPIDAPVVLDQLVATVLPHAEQVALIGYSGGRQAGDLLLDLSRRVREAGLGVFDVILVRARHAEFPVDGRPSIVLPGPGHATAQALSEAAALAGRAVLSDREQVRSSIAGPRGADRRRAVAELRRAGTWVDAELDTLRASRADPGPAFGLTLIHRTVEELSTRHSVSTGTAAALAVCLVDTTVRDEVLVEIIADRASPWVPALVGAAARIPDEGAAEVCALLAFAAYREGDGALAQVALERCRRGNPFHRLAALLAEGIDAGIRPERLDGLLRIRELPPPGE